MSKLAFACLTLIISLNLLSPAYTAYAEETTTLAPTPSLAPSAESPSAEPSVRIRFYSASAVEAIPKLKHLQSKNPGYNKIQFLFDNFPKNKEIILEIKRPLSKTPEQYHHVMTFTIQNDGTYLTDTKERLNFIAGSSRGYLPGERVFVRFHTSDDSLNKEISGTPHPVIFRDRKGVIVMRAELLTQDPTVYLIELPTMNDGEEYELKSVALGSTTKAKPKYSSKEPLHFSPTPTGKSQGGSSTFEVKRKSGEVYKLTLPWGTALDIYKQGEKSYPYHD